MVKTEQKPKMGRPPKEGPLPKHRQIGRVHNEHWELWKRATKKSGQSFTQWAVDALNEKAARELKKAV